MICNLCAVYISAGENDKAIKLYEKYQNYSEETFELGFNVACAFLEVKNYIEAQRNLEKTVCNYFFIFLFLFLFLFLF